MTYQMHGKSGGMSLVELLVALTIGLFIISAAGSLFVVSKRSYTESERNARTGENARIALQTLTTQLRMAGFFGEAAPAEVSRDASLGDVADDCDAPAGAYDVANYLVVTRTDDTGAALGCITDAVPQTDVIVIKSVRPRVLSDGDREDLGDDDGKIDSPEGLGKELTYVMTNPLKGVIFDGADTPPTIGEGGEIPRGTAWQYRYEAYYVRNDDVPQLARKVLQWNGAKMALVTEDLVEAVENLRVMIGEDANSDGEVDSYEPAADVGDWSRVSAVKLYLLVRTVDKDPRASKEARTYALGDENIDKPADGYRRIVMESSLALRNARLNLREG